MSEAQIWKCVSCGRKRIWGNAPRPDMMFDGPVELLVRAKTLLVCEGACNYGKLNQSHTAHTYVETKPMRGAYVTDEYGRSSVDGKPTEGNVFHKWGKPVDLLRRV
jgi:hypothetical protein